MALEIRNISCGYNKQPVLENISFEVSVNEIVCLLGPNGIGKTTLFKTILTLQDALSGSIAVDGVDLSTMQPPARAKLLSYVPQRSDVLFPYTVFEMVLMGRASAVGFYASPSKKDKEKADNALSMLSLQKLKKRIFNKLSGGERQLVLLARAICQGARYMILDEPTSNLDFGNQALVLSEVQNLKKQGFGICMTTHCPNQALFSADRVLLIDRKRQIRIGKPNEVIDIANIELAYGVKSHIANTRIKEGKSLTYCLPLYERQ